MAEGTYTCDAPGCDRELGPSDVEIVFETPAGSRKWAAECACGALTILVRGRDRFVESDATE